MSEDVSLQLLLEELKGCRRQIDGLVTDVANLKAVEKTQAETMQRFWSENWGPLKADIQDIKSRITSVEKYDMQKLERRMDAVESDNRLLTEAELNKRISDLEKLDARRKGVAAAAGALGGGGIAAFFRWFLEGGG